MRRDPRSLLWDIVEAAAAIDAFIDGFDLDRHAQSPLVHSAVARKLEIIGDAPGQLPKIDGNLAARIPDARQIVAFRNLLIHGYAMVDHARVFRTIHENLPAMRKKVATLLSELDSNDAS